MTPTSERIPRLPDLRDLWTVTGGKIDYALKGHARSKGGLRNNGDFQYMMAMLRTHHRED